MELNRLAILLVAGILSGICLMGGEVAAEKTVPSVGSTLTTTNGFTNGTLYPIVTRHPAGPPKIATGLTNFHGQQVMASCSACHTTTKPNLEIRSSEELDQFHQGLKYNHGKLTCLSCHNSGNYDTLRMADTRAVEFTDVMTLCSQCHGPQRRDYDRGLHGGMNGHWDRTRGGRTRNNCTICHDPHTPVYPLVMPVLPPRDRISVPAKPQPQSEKH